MNPYRPGSRVARAYDIYCESGPDETLRIGLSEMGLKEGTLRGWLRMWSKKGPVPKDEKPSARTVRMKSDHSWVGTITEPGKEVSGIKWRNGIFQYCPNHWFEKVE